VASAWNRWLVALLGIGSIGWFGDFGFISFVPVAPQVQTLISPGATPWETRSPTSNPSPEGAKSGGSQEATAETENSRPIPFRCLR
jgi:hypothetical protein